MVSARETFDTPEESPEGVDESEVFFSIHDSVIELGGDILEMPLESSNMGEGEG